VWTLGALLLLGAVLALPVPVLTLMDGRSQIVERLDDGEAYVYSYVNSVYEATVEERHVRRGDALQITGVQSADIRAVEYFRWDGEPVRDGALWLQQAPRANETPRLMIRVTPRYSQRIVGDRWDVDLAATFGDAVVSVTPGRMPLAVALLHGWRP
jgi:hypothetical protein